MRKETGANPPVRRAILALVPTRYLIIGALATALVILAGVGAWFLLGLL